MDCKIKTIGKRDIEFNGHKYTCSIFQYNGKTYSFALDEERHPCDKCVVRYQCEHIIDEDIMMLCGCEFCTDPWYIIDWNE